MSSMPSAACKTTSVPPAWLGRVLGATLPNGGEALDIGGQQFIMRNGIPRAVATLSATQAQTQQSFAFIWDSRERFQSDESLATMGAWYREMYGDVSAAPWWDDYGASPLLLDAGCGAGISALGLFGERLRKVRYLGVDVSTAVEAAAERLAARDISAAFLQASLMELPLADGSVDVIFSQGVLHHTDSTQDAIHALARKLKVGGRFLFYVYRKKGPIREFTDDYIRDRLRQMAPGAAWDALMPLTKFGKALAELKVEIEVPEAIDLLGIPAGKIDLQRFFYWHVFKAYHRPEWTLDELNHVNLDWYAPINAHRHTPEEVRTWCDEAGLEIEREHLQESGITIIAKKRGG